MFDSPSTPFQRLAAKGAQGQWSVADIQDWDGDVGAPKWLPRKFQSALISQFYHGELATLKMCRRVLAEIGDPEAKRCLSFQISDEERHARIYLAYLEKTGGRLQPVDPVLEAAYDKALAWSGPPEGLICAFNIILEGEALFALDYLGGWLTCPLFKRINERISRDEARHTAYGVKYLPRAVSRLSDHEREDLEDFAFEAARMLIDSRQGPTMRQSVLGLWQSAGLDTKEVLADLAKDRERIAGGNPVRLLRGSARRF